MMMGQAQRRPFHVIIDIWFWAMRFGKPIWFSLLRSYSRPKYTVSPGLFIKKHAFFNRKKNKSLPNYKLSKFYRWPGSMFQIFLMDEVLQNTEKYTNSTYILWKYIPILPTMLVHRIIVRFIRKMLLRIIIQMAEIGLKFILWGYYYSW